MGVEGGEIIAAGGQCVVKRVSEVPALPNLAGGRDNRGLLAYDGIFQYRERSTHSNSRMTVTGTYNG